MSIYFNVEKGQIVEIVLLLGDFLWVWYIVEIFLENFVQYNIVCGMLGFIGIYKGECVSVQGIGMGILSCMIYVNELIQDYGCKNLICVGMVGSYQEGVYVCDFVLVQVVCIDSNINCVCFGECIFVFIVDFELLLWVYQIVQECGFSVYVGNIMSSDIFYNDNLIEFQCWVEFGVLVVEMEVVGFYIFVVKYGVWVLIIFIISDYFVIYEVIFVEECQFIFNGMIEVVFDVVFGLEKKVQSV